MSSDESFVEKFLACMSEANVQLSETNIADPGYFTDSVKYVKSWFDDLDDRTRTALDAAGETGDPVAVHLATHDVAPGIADLMRDFDANTGWPVSTLLDWCLHCIDVASSDAD